MKYMKQTLLYALIVTVVVIGGLTVYKFSGNATKQPKSAMIYPKFKAVEPFKLSHGSEQFTEQHLKDKWSFVFFGYTYCPDICPTTMAAMREMYLKLPKSIQKDTQVILVSVDPERDNPEQLSVYTKAFHEDFVGVTAEHSELQTFAKSFGAIYYKVGDDKEDYLVDHTGRIFLVDPLGQRHAIFQKSLVPANGFEFNLDEMVNDYLIIRG